MLQVELTPRRSSPRSRSARPRHYLAQRGRDQDVAPRPPLKWAGGKRWQIPHLLEFWVPASRHRLVEPFCGGLAVTLGLMPRRALLNDINPHLINFYRALKKGLMIKMKMKNASHVYYSHRQRFNKLLAEGRTDSTDVASLFYYLNRTGYNGLCRFNRQGAYNVPFGRYKTINYKSDFRQYKSTFSRFEFISADFEQIPLEPKDFVYADPPYDVEFTQYSRHSFEWEEQVRTAEWLAQHPGSVILSNQGTDRIVKLYKQLGYELRFLKAPRLISCTGDRTPAREVLATRNL
ncbi:MAG: Dam family site-specific DNA-(adenine-N6)-methyltransferase [Acidobacteriota bacterium]